MPLPCLMTAAGQKFETRYGHCRIPCRSREYKTSFCRRGALFAEVVRICLLRLL